MTHYSQGKSIKQAHKGIPEDHYEEEQGLKGFYGPVSHLIKEKPSTRWVEIQGTLRPHLFDLVKIKEHKKWVKLLENSDLAVYKTILLKNTRPHTAQRNADGSTIYFIHSGEGVLFTEYGSLTYKTGDYVVMPKCLTHTWSVSEDSVLLIIENKTSHYISPDRGIAGRNALYDDQALQRPNLEKQKELMSANNIKVDQIHIKREEKETKFFYDSCVYDDVVGWKGDLYPFVLSMSDIMPIMSHRSHLPPSAHTTFVGKEFVICTFLPRPLESDEDALKVPFYHQNIDYDEVLFYHDGDFFSRDNLHAGMMTLHPAGFPHGPHPKAVKGIEGKTHTNESAVMIDSRKPLKVCVDLERVEDLNYWKSWKA